jgi:hypothetical protein
MAVSIKTRLASEVSGNSVIRKRAGSGGRFQPVRANGTDIFLTALVTFHGETASMDVDMCAKGEAVFGVIVGPSYTALDLAKDYDSPYSDNTYLQMYIPVHGDQIYLTSKVNSSITYGHYVQCDGGFIIDFAFANSAEATDTIQSVVGAALEAITGATSVVQICLVQWGAL